MDYGAPAKAKKPMDDDEMLRLARERMDEAYSSDIEQRELAADDLKKVIGEQWPEHIRREREADGKPCLTFNGLSQFVRQVTGQIRNLNPAIKALPASQDATEDVAEVYEGLIRQIEYASDASSVYEASAESAAACGMGAWRVRSDYAPGMTFDQEILIERIYNPFAVFWDPFARHPTRCDARYCFITEEISKDDFEASYPGKQCADVTGDHRPDHVQHWRSADGVVVAEYFWREHEERRIVMLEDGQVLENPPKGMQFRKERTVKVPVIKWAKISGVDVLEGPLTIPCEHIPVVAVTGEEWHLGEEVYRSGVIRHAKDAQQLYNYARSAGAELIALQPKAPYLVTTKQVAQLEDYWKQANRSNLPYLPYNPDPAAPPPMRVPPPVPSSAMLNEIQLAAEDMKRTTGIYDASLGAKSNETSGVAIRQRQQEAQLGTSVYADNMVKGIVQTGNILVSMIPKVYDTRRVIRILGESDQEKQVIINDVVMSDMGEMPINDLTVGRYDVRINVGPAYATRKQEAAEGMLEFVSKVPAAQAAADIIAEMQEWPEAERVAARIKKTLPPGILEDDEKEQQDPQAQQMQMMQAQAQQQAQQQAQEMQMREGQAKVAKAEADAQKAGAEAQKAQLEIMQMTGQIDSAIAARVQVEVTKLLMGQQPMQQAPMGQQQPGFPA
jgi:hypothetical protein